MKFSLKTRLIEFFVVGIVMGLIEDFLVIWLVTGEPISWHVFWIVVVIAIPFAYINEYITDHPDFWTWIFPKKLKYYLFNKKYEAKVRIFEFFMIGVVFGVGQDIIALLASTDVTLSWYVVGIATAVSIPFAFFSEIIVDHPDFWTKVLKK